MLAKESWWLPRAGGAEGTREQVLTGDEKLVVVMVERVCEHTSH